MGWQDALATAESGSLSGIANAYKRQALREQSDLEQDLYARGYRGTPTDQIDVKRGALGSILQSAGILGAPEPDPMTEYQRYIYEQGGRKRQLEDMMMEASKTDLSDKKNLARFNAFKEAHDMLGWTGVSSPELVSPEYPELTNDYLGAVHNYDRDSAFKQSQREAELAYAKLRNTWYEQGVEGTRQGNENQKDMNLLNSWERGPLGASLRQELIKWSGDPNHPELGGGKLESLPTDPAELSMQMQEYSALKRRARQSLENSNISPRLIDIYMSRFKDFGDYESDPYRPFGALKDQQQSTNQGTMPNSSPMGREDFDKFVGGIGTGQ